MNFNWRDVLIRNISIDEVVEKISGLGIPGLVLLVAISGSGLFGGAAIVSGLATLGGPFGMIGGIGTIVLSGFIAAAISKYGFENIFRRVIKKLREQGATEEEILQKINRYPLAKELKLKLREYIENMEFAETGDAESPERVQEILSIMEHLIGEGIGQLESRLDEKIDDAKKDLNNRMDASEKRLKGFIGVAVAVGSIITIGIVALIVGFLN